MSTHDGYYKQTDGLADVWLSRHNPTIKDNAKLYDGYMDDVLRSIKKQLIDRKLAEINSPSLFGNTRAVPAPASTPA